MCENAAQDFQNIVFTVGGPNERIRHSELMNKVIIYYLSLDSWNFLEGHFNLYLKLWYLPENIEKLF